MSADEQRSWKSVADSGCASEGYQRAMGFQVDPWRLDECLECEFCGGCATHFCYRDEKSSALHMDWFMAFASPGEAECGSVGGPPNLVPSQYQPRPCQLPAGHKGKHRARMGWSWPVGTGVPGEAP